jgi:hypothetical protein
MSWESELREEIKLTSPSGSVFYALWRENERSKDKKLGLFDPPKFQGTFAQDLGIKSTTYPLNIFFDGIFHNREAEDFYNACDEEGQWEVIHPTKGPLILQLISVTEVISPVENGNYTEFATNWLEPANIERLISPEELATSILSQIINGFGDALLVLQQIRTDAYSLIQSVANMINKIAGSNDIFLQELSATSALVTDAYDTAKAAYNNAIANFGIDNPDTNDVGNSIIDMNIAPVAVSTDFVTRFTKYKEMLEDIETFTPVDASEDNKNKLYAQEFGITVPLIVIAQIVITSEFASRVEVISAINNLITLFDKTMMSIEESQTLYSTLDIDFQYFSQTKTYTSLVNIYSLVIRYLLSQFFNLASEKIFTLKKARSPIEITVTEYGSLGENDENYDLFLKSNNLSGNDILILPAGREVLIYA